MKALDEIDQWSRSLEQQLVRLITNSQGIYILEKDNVIELHLIMKSTKKANKYNVVRFEIETNTARVLKSVKDSTACLKISDIQSPAFGKRYSWFKLQPRTLLLPIFASQIMTTAAENVGQFSFIQSNQNYQLNLMSCISGWACPSIESLNNTFNIIKNNVINFCNATAINNSLSSVNYSSTIVCESLQWEHKLFTNNYTYQLQSNTNISSALLNCVKSQIQHEQGCELPDWRTALWVMGIITFFVIIGCLLKDKKKINNTNYSATREPGFFKKVSPINRQSNENLSLLPSNVEPVENKNASCLIL